MANPYLLLWFEAPLQSWGADSKFGIRDTLNFPTKSGVLGLVCSALGYGGGQNEFLNTFVDLNIQVISFNKIGKDKKKLPREPQLKDFHMIGSGYDDKDPWQKLLIPKKSDGGKAVGGGSKITNRSYLQDAVFAVLLEVPLSLVDLLTNALQYPVWDIYLGRKSCIPTEIIFQGKYDSIELAIHQANIIAASKNYVVGFEVLSGKHSFGDVHVEVMVLNDVPIQFGDHKKYKDRYITVFDKST